jgi:hypothetical protein
MTADPADRLASVLAGLEYAPGVFVRDEDNLADFAARLIAAGVGDLAEARQQERDRIAALVAAVPYEFGNGQYRLTVLAAIAAIEGDSRE